MALNLNAYKALAPAAIDHFWDVRRIAVAAQSERGVTDQGNRGAVTTGKSMDGFIHLLRTIAIENGLDNPSILTEGVANLTIPGFYRPAKKWDLLVVARQQLVAAIEFKSQVGPSFGNNFNNRVEVIGECYRPAKGVL